MLSACVLWLLLSAETRMLLLVQELALLRNFEAKDMALALKLNKFQVGPSRLLTQSSLVSRSVGPMSGVQPRVSLEG